MKLDNTIYESIYLNPDMDSVQIDDNTIFYKLNNNFVYAESILIPFNQWDEQVFEYFFSKYPNLKYIKLNRAVFTKNEILPKKTLRIKHFDNNFCLGLPDTIEKYRASLGKKTRMHLGQYCRHIEQEFLKQGGGFFTTNFTNDSKYIFDEIVKLNIERCYSKGVIPGDNTHLFSSLRDAGVLNYLKIGDKIVAGTIGSVYNNQFCLHVIAHSNDYGQFNPGNVILYKTIENVIAQKIPVFNFLWGGCEYKSRFGAKEMQLFDYYIYRKFSDYLVHKLKALVIKLIKKAKSVIKSILRPPYHAAKWLYHHTLKRQPKSCGYIFMLHRVDDFEECHLWCNEHMKVTPGFLDSTIASLKEKYDIIPLSDVPERLTQKNNRKFIVFTMDDGYKDNYTKALPVFKKHNVPYTIFVTTDFPDKKAVLWWYELEDLLLSNECVALSNGVTYPAHNYQEKCDSFLKIRQEILKLNQLDLENELNKLFSNYKISWTSQCERLCLSWDEIKALKNEPLVTIGAHTRHHYNLKQLGSEKDVSDEVLSGVNLLKEKTGIEPKVFAYPFGSPLEAGKREYKVLSSLPFDCSCIAYGGPCAKKHAKKLSSLPRIMLKQSFKTEDLK